jgi:para-nitrobenzyl esterase
MDIGFVFDNVAKSAAMSGVGEEQQAIADMMSEAWLAFARNGNPNHEGLPQWAPYDAKGRATMVIDNVPRLINDPIRAELDLLDSAL